jgi:hypothetical protein
MTASLPAHEIINMYKKISLDLENPSLLVRLRNLFKRRRTLLELLEWVHTRLKFNKGNIIRHNDPFEILDYGQGKCREFSVLFTAICSANGYRARIILDMSDHAWTEVWSLKQKRWIHIDPTERRIDDPEMYEREWKKTLTKVYAFEDGTQKDVTAKYKIKQK